MIFVILLMMRTDYEILIIDFTKDENLSEL